MDPPVFVVQRTATLLARGSDWGSESGWESAWETGWKSL